MPTVDGTDGVSRGGGVRRNRKFLLNVGGNHRTWPLEQIKDIHRRRYLLKNNALEFFLTNGKTYLLVLNSKADRDAAYDKVNDVAGHAQTGGVGPPGPPSWPRCLAL